MAGGHLPAVGHLLSREGGGHPAARAGVPVMDHIGFGRFLPVVPDLDIISSGALFVRWVDRCQFVLASFLVVDSGWISFPYEKLL